MMHTAHKTQRGFTMVELMVAVTIGLALTIVVATLFLHSRSTYGSTDETSRMQENMRYAQELLNRMVHHASYTSSPNVYKDVEDSVSNSSAAVVFDAAQPALAATDGGNGGTPAQALPDSFIVRFQGTGPAGAADGAVTDCQGRAVDGTQISVNRFYIRPVGTNGGPALWCDATLAGVTTEAEIVPDVENMQLVFGEDLVDDNGNAIRDGSVEKYTELGALTVPTLNKVVALRVALLFRTPNLAAAVLPESTRTYDLNGNAVGPFTDTRIRRVLTMTINLRNRSA